jgi:hypothetical protein
MTLSKASEIRERLTTCLDKLSKIKSTHLIREEELGPQLNFRAGMPFFERTLTLYRQIANTNLSRVPSEILEIVANHAEESLHQFEQIEAFTPAGIDRPEQIRNLLINDVRDGYAAIYDEVSIILAPSRGQSEKLLREPSRMPMMTMMTVLAFVVVAALLGYHYSLYEGLIHDLQDQMSHFLAR